MFLGKLFTLDGVVFTDMQIALIDVEILLFKNIFFSD